MHAMRFFLARNLTCPAFVGGSLFLLGHKMTATFAITQIVSVEAVESEQFEVRLMLEDTSEVVLRMDGPTLCTLADMVSQYATA